MAFYGDKGGDILNVDLYNSKIEVLNFHKKANFVLNCDGGTNNSESDTTQKLSFYQQRDYLTIITVYISKTPITYTYPRIKTSIDRDDTPQVYTHVSDSTESFTFKISTTEEYTVYLLKTKYSTSFKGDIWLEVDIIDGEKSFDRPITQYLIAQHNDTETLLPTLKREGLSDISDWTAVRDYLNTTDKLSYCMNIFNAGDIEQGQSGFFRKFDNHSYFKKMEGYYKDVLRFQQKGLQDYLFISSVQHSDTIYTKGTFFTDFDLSMFGHSLNDYLYNSMHVTFPIKYYLLRSTNSEMSLSSTDLYMLKKVVDGLSNLGTGKVGVHNSAMQQQSTSFFKSKLEIVKSSDNYFTLGNGIKIYFEFDLNFT